MCTGRPIILARLDLYVGNQIWIQNNGWSEPSTEKGCLEGYPGDWGRVNELPNWWRISLLPISHWSTQKRISFQTSFQTSLGICILSRFSAQNIEINAVSRTTPEYVVILAQTGIGIGPNKVKKLFCIRRWRRSRQHGCRQILRDRDFYFAVHPL